jgi:hypothetical protein
LANDLIRFLDAHHEALFNNHKEVGDWGLGDKCYSWMQTGSNPMMTTGAEMVDLLAGAGTDVTRWALEFSSDEQTGDIIIDSKFDVPVPLGIGYFSRFDPANFDIVDVTINESQGFTIDPSMNKSGLNIKHATMMTFAYLGNAQPGKNVTKITTKEKRDRPFQATGLYLCGACAEKGHLGQGAANYST